MVASARSVEQLICVGIRHTHVLNTATQAQKDILPSLGAQEWGMRMRGVVWWGAK